MDAYARLLIAEKMIEMALTRCGDRYARWGSKEAAILAETFARRPRTTC
jgi:hypothetical protein